MKKTTAFLFVLVCCLTVTFGQQLAEKKKIMLDLLLTEPDTYLGRLSANPYQPDSTSNKAGIYGSPYGVGVNNPYSTAGAAAKSKFSSFGSPVIVGEDGNYLGRLNQNKFDSDSVSNPYGRYGSKYSKDSVNNPYSVYGSPYSSKSATNPYASQAPRLYAPTYKPYTPPSYYVPYKVPAYHYEPPAPLWKKRN